MLQEASVALPRTLGELSASGYRARSVKEEMRENLIRMLRAKEELFPGIVGYDATVVPGLVNAILSKHDFILLGLRGQAKTRILRSLVAFLDDGLPVLAGTETNDDPFAPVSRKGRELVASRGDESPIEWISREARYREKLATPDVTIADLIGDIDPIKAATRKLSYADEEVIHFGIIPRTNRGIFALNELPDLPPRIQVGLLNIMEEKDIQIRGFPLRMRLDILMVYSANPEDYTNRGNIITPLKDRIDSQILTHYPADLAAAMRITAQEAWTSRDGASNGGASGGDALHGQAVLSMPDWYRELVEEVAFAARKSEFVNQSSGVSARMSISLLENVLSNMERRAILHDETAVFPRISDLHAAVTAVTGKIELVYEGEQQGAQIVARKIIGEAVKEAFRRRFPDPSPPRKRKKRQEQEDEDDVPVRPEKPAPSPYQPILSWFSKGNRVETSDETPQREYVKSLESVEGLSEITARFLAPAGSGSEARGSLAAAMEFVLEGLHQHSMISKWEEGNRTAYRDMLKAMFDHMAVSDSN
ncbi:MAG: magnesium chelatase [Acidobacteria bacterium]|nr:magnesium chelatase [Acidobacteriota bacterium]